MEVDYLVVGSGLAGSVIARTLWDNSFNVLVLERRSHVGGNVYDEIHPSGIRYHTYGPHLFRTSSERIWDYVNRYAEFYPYEHVVRTLIDGNLEQWPVSQEYIKRACKGQPVMSFPQQATNFEEACLMKMPKRVYEKFIKEYTKKHWGVSPRELSTSLAERVEIRSGGDPRLFTNRYQGLPKNGYAQFMASLLEGIPVLLDVDYLEFIDSFQVKKKLIFTGSIDSFFGYEFGRLRYRTQKRIHTYLPDCAKHYPVGVVNTPSYSDGAQIRIIEWKHFVPPESTELFTGTLLTSETPSDAETVDGCEYPFPDRGNEKLLEMYQEKARSFSNVVFCGRLGEYRYFDMDHVIERALMLAEELIEESELDGCNVPQANARADNYTFEHSGADLANRENEIKSK